MSQKPDSLCPPRLFLRWRRHAWSEWEHKPKKDKRECLDCGVSQEREPRHEWRTIEETATSSSTIRFKRFRRCYECGKDETLVSWEKDRWKDE